MDNRVYWIWLQNAFGAGSPKPVQLVRRIGSAEKLYQGGTRLWSSFSFVSDKELAALNAYGAEKAAEALGVGVPTLRDIAKELSKPGRDPRDELPAPILRTDVLDIKDLKPGMVLTGTVRNVIDFGAFVDIGVHQDGLVHITQISDKFVRHPSDVLKVGDIVTVWVLAVDVARGRISLTMKKPKEQQN